VLLCDKLVSSASDDQGVLSEAPSNVSRGTPPITSTPVSGTLHFVEVYTYSMAPYNSDYQAAADFDSDQITSGIVVQLWR